MGMKFMLKVKYLYIKIYKYFLDLIEYLFIKFRKIVLKLYNKGNIEKILSEKNYNDKVLITITFGSRKFNNPDNNLLNFLNSFLQNTKNIKLIEILIKIDEDDDFLFFYKLKCIFSKSINLRFFITPRGYGYEDMHIWHHQLLSHKSISTKYNYILTDDAFFEILFWDIELFEMIKNRRNSISIFTSCTLEAAITMHGPNPIKPIPIYWIGGDDYPIYGIDLLNTIKKITDNIDGWNEFGNTQLLDQYAGSILKILYDKYNLSIHTEISLFASRRGGQICWSNNFKRNEIRSRTLLKHQSFESNEIRNIIAKEIYSDYLNLNQ